MADQVNDSDVDSFLANDSSSAPSPPPEEPEESGIMPPAAPEPGASSSDVDSFLEPENAAKFGTPEQKGLTFTEGLMRGFASQPVATGVELGAGEAPERILGRQKENPWTSFAGEVTGGALGLYSGYGELAWLNKIIGGGAEAGQAVKLSQLAVKGLFDTQALIGGDEISHAMLHDPDTTIGSAAVHLGLGAVLGPAIGVAPALWSATKGKVTSGILNFIKDDSTGVGARLISTPEAGDPAINDLTKTALSMGLGVPPSAVDAYVSEREAIRGLPEFQDIHQAVATKLQTIQDNASAQQALLKQAQDMFTARGYRADIASNAADTVFKQAQQDLITQARDTAWSKAPGIANAVQMLRDDVVSGSQGAYEHLMAPDNAEIMLPTQPLADAADVATSKLREQVGPQSVARINAIDGYISSIRNRFGDEIPPVNAKILVQELDDLTDYSKNAADFDKGLNPYYKIIRGTLDDMLKGNEENGFPGVPGYADLMKPVAENAQLLNDIGPSWGSSEEALKSIDRLKNNELRSEIEVPKLERLQAATGTKFLDDIVPYTDKNIQQQNIEKLPQYAQAVKAQEASDWFNDPRLQGRNKEEKLFKMRQEWVSAMSALEKIHGVRPENLQTVLEQVMRGKSINARKLAMNLPAFEGQSIPELMDAMAVKNVFEKSNTNGSKNVNLGGGLGSTIGGLAGGMIGGLPGASIGAGMGGGLGMLAGAAIDKKGPAYAQKLLDLYLDHFGDLPKNSGLSQRATKYALRAMMGKDVPPNADAFRAAGKLAEDASQGMTAIKAASRALYKKNIEAVPRVLVPTKEQTKDLDDRIKVLQNKPKEMFALGGEVGHYMPNHATSLGAIAGRAVNTLNSLRPEFPQLSPLDTKMEPSPVEKSTYRGHLEVAQQPLMMIHHMQHNTLTPAHVNTFKTIYPELYHHMGKELTDAMVEHLSEEKTIPFKLRQGLSTYLGQPMDSSLSQPSIAAAQGSLMMSQPPPTQAPVTKNKRDTSKIGEAPNQYRTADQSAQMRQSQKG